MKLISERGIDSSTKTVYKRSLWSPRAAIEAGLVTVLTAGAIVYATLSSDSNYSEGNMTVLLVGGILGSVLLGAMLYFTFQEQSFITAIRKKYGYSIENLAESIPDTISEGNNYSRMLLPMSPKMPPNVDIYVVRNKNGIFVEEIHH